MATPDYVLKEDVTLRTGDISGFITLSAGTFVRPIELVYVPHHTINNSTFKDFDKSKDVFCYTRYGMLPLPKDKMRQV